MNSIRPFEPADSDAVAGLFQRVIRKSNAAPSPELAPYFRHLLLDSPGCDSEISSLVHLNGSGDITGFIGVNALPMSFQGTPVRAAVCGSLMVETRDSDPMAGARLLKAYLAGPQDISFSETASVVATQMWTRLRGIVLPQYSLDWTRVIRPTAFSLDVAATRIKAARLLHPLARGIDHLVCKTMRQDGLNWQGVAEKTAVPGGLKVAETDAGGFGEFFDPLTAQFSLRPDWAGDQFAFILAEAANKPEYGDPVLAMVTARGGKPIGAFFYHVRPGGIARVLQILSLPGQAGPVVDCLIADATARGAAGLRGRTQPALLEAMLGRRIAFVHTASTVIHSRDENLVQAFRNSQGFFNGLAGEHWNRLFGAGLF
jgi:hypothetical protein